MPVEKVRPISHSFKENDGHYKQRTVGTAFFYPDRISILIDPGMAVSSVQDSFITIWFEDKKEKER